MAQRSRQPAVEISRDTLSLPPAAVQPRESCAPPQRGAHEALAVSHMMPQRVQNSTRWRCCCHSLTPIDPSATPETPTHQISTRPGLPVMLEQTGLLDVCSGMLSPAVESPAPTSSPQCSTRNKQGNSKSPSLPGHALYPPEAHAVYFLARQCYSPSVTNMLDLHSDTGQIPGCIGAANVLQVFSTRSGRKPRSARISRSVCRGLQQGGGIRPVIRAMELSVDRIFTCRVHSALRLPHVRLPADLPISQLTYHVAYYRSASTAGGGNPWGNGTLYISASLIGICRLLAPRRSLQPC